MGSIPNQSVNLKASVRNDRGDTKGKGSVSSAGTGITRQLPSKPLEVINGWVRTEYNQRHCDKNGHLVGSVNLNKLTFRLTKLRPDIGMDIKACVGRLHMEICEQIAQEFSVNRQGQFEDIAAFSKKLLQARPDLKDDRARSQVIIQLQDARKASLNGMHPPVPSKPLKKPLHSAESNTSQSRTTMTESTLKAWISSLYLQIGFKGGAFIGWSAFLDALVKAKPELSRDIGLALRVMRSPGDAFSLENPNIVQKRRAAARRGGVQLIDIPVPGQPSTRSETPQKKKPAISLPSTPGVSKDEHNLFTDASTLLPSDESSTYSARDDTSEDSSDERPPHNFRKRFEPNYRLINQLITQRNRTSIDDVIAGASKRDIGHAPLLSDIIVEEHAKDFVPQFGFLGSKGAQSGDMKVFQNTNVPFSTFICGVQGSGKSHTTACMLENALIPSQHLGRLEAPVAALVFNYGEFSNGGSEFTVSEAAFLASTNKTIASHRVKDITVLVSPSNPAIKKFYRAIPGVKVIDFKLKAKTLDIATLLTLMSINEKVRVPLYMAKVESILRTIATESEDGFFDYDLFKQRIALENFDPTQNNMLEMRLGLLESFLDKDDNIPEPTFRPGGMTIMDLSDPFVTPTTACILFKLGLERFMQSRTPSKMVVLDEAHKYMLDTPGSKMLTNYLDTLIRLQRHRGVRVIISTQEPTVSTDLIALCSVTVIHRFTSPAWYLALKKHISAMDNDKEILRQIESLDTGEALVYAPTAVVGKKDDGALIKLPGQLLRLNIRKRITKDGGESIMAI